MVHLPYIIFFLFVSFAESDYIPISFQFSKNNSLPIISGCFSKNNNQCFPFLLSTETTRSFILSKNQYNLGYLHSQNDSKDIKISFYYNGYQLKGSVLQDKVNIENTGIIIRKYVIYLITEGNINFQSGDYVGILGIGPADKNHHFSFINNIITEYSLKEMFAISYASNKMYLVIGEDNDRLFIKDKRRPRNCSGTSTSEINDIYQCEITACGYYNDSGLVNIFQLNNNKIIFNPGVNGVYVPLEFFNDTILGIVFKPYLGRHPYNCSTIRSQNYNIYISCDKSLQEVIEAIGTGKVVIGKWSININISSGIVGKDNHYSVLIYTKNVSNDKQWILGYKVIHDVKKEGFEMSYDGTNGGISGY